MNTKYQILLSKITLSKNRFIQNSRENKISHLSFKTFVNHENLSRYIDDLIEIDFEKRFL